MILLDTSAIVAVAAPKDDNHEKAKRHLLGLPEGDSLVCSDYVFDETTTLLAARHGHAVAVRVGESLRSSTFARVETLRPTDLDRAWELFVKYTDKKLSFTDCTTVALAERLKPRFVFAFDAGLSKIGLKVEP